MNYIKEVKGHFAQGVREYIRDNLSIELLTQFLKNKSEIFPFLAKNGMSEESLSQIESLESLEKELTKFSNNELIDLNLSTSQIMNLLESHPLVKLKEKPSRIFLVGSFACGRQHQDSDIDILIEVKKRSYPSSELEDKYRRKLQNYFMKNNIREKDDSVHPTINSRRVDIYFTYDADLESRPKIELQ